MKKNTVDTGKTFKFYYRKNYFPLFFPLLNQNVPNFLIKMLINKYVVFLLDRPLLNQLLFKTLVFLENLKEK